MTQLVGDPDMQSLMPTQSAPRRHWRQGHGRPKLNDAHREQSPAWMNHIPLKRKHDSYMFHLIVQCYAKQNAVGRRQVLGNGKPQDPVLM